MPDPNETKARPRRLFLSMMVSADGFIAGPRGELDWHTIDDDFNAYVMEMLQSIDGILLGRRTYEQLSEYWPTADAPEANLMNELPKYVVFTRLDHPAWANTTVVANVELKSQPGRDLALFASAQLASSLAAAHLINEYRIVVCPVFLGSGTPFFSDLRRRIPLSLARSERFASGAVFNAYEPRAEARG